MIEQVRTEGIPEIVDTLNQVIDEVNTIVDVSKQHELEALALLSNEADIADIVSTLNNLIITLRGGVQ